MSRPLPWQTQQWQQLQAAGENNRIPHALLLTGPAQTGKRRFAEALAESLLCRSPGAEHLACGDCQACRLMAAGTHADLAFLLPEEAGKAIKIDTVREFIQKEGLSSQFGGYKIRIIDPADAMNIASANALLKTLEEPTPQSLLLLVSSNPGRLPATIRSRCQAIDFPLPDKQQALQWLAEQGAGDWETLLSVAAGAPLKALALAEEGLTDARSEMLGEFFALLEGRADPVRVAADWAGRDCELLLDWLGNLLMDLLRLQANPDLPALLNPDVADRLQRLSQQKSAEKWHKIMQILIETRKSLTRQLNLQLQLEGLLIGLTDDSGSVRGEL